MKKFIFLCRSHSFLTFCEGSAWGLFNNCRVTITLILIHKNDAKYYILTLNDGMESSIGLNPPTFTF